MHHAKRKFAHAKEKPCFLAWAFVLLDCKPQNFWPFVICEL